jgi:hypothetical protein
MFSKFERSVAPGERGNAAVVALCVTTLAVAVVMGIRLVSGSDSSKPIAPIAAANIGAGASDADPSGTARASSGPIAAAVSSAGLGSSGSSGNVAAGASAPVPTLPGSVPTIPPDGAVPAAAPVPIVAVDVTPTTSPAIILGLKTPQAASRNLFDAWKENDRGRARRFATQAAVEVIFREPWGAEVQDDGCTETSNPTSFHCAFVGDEVAWILVVDQRIGPSGREFVPTRTIRTNRKTGSSLPYAPPIPEPTDPAGGGSSDSSPTTTIEASLLGDAPLVDPAEVPDLASPTIQDPSVLDPVGAAAALADEAASNGTDPIAGSGTKPSTKPSAKAPKKKKPTVRRPKSAVSSSKSAATTDAGVSSDAPAATKATKKADPPAASSSGGAEPAAPSGGAVKAGAPPVNEVDG